MLDPDQLDEVYTQACRNMTELGDAKIELFLARLALRLMKEVGDSQVILACIEETRRSVASG